jgi:tetratricopeptide (TPR) repeat protein
MASFSRSKRKFRLTQPSNRPKPLPPERNRPGAVRKPGLDFWISFGLLVAVLAMYGQVRSHAFVSFDDPIYVTENPQVRSGLTWSGLVWAFTTFHGSNWFPLTWLSHMLDCQLFGLDSGWHHLTNVWLHALSTLVLFAVLRRMTGARWRSGMVALLFAVHPLHVESVAWLAERKDVLSALFWMLTLWAYAGYAARPGRARYALAFFLFCLGLMAKQMLVTLPVVLLLLDLWPLGRGVRILEKLPFFAASLASSMVAYISHQTGEAVASFEMVPLAIRFENALITYAVYVLQSFWPSHLAVFYPYSLQSLVVPAIFAGVALCAVTLLVVLAFPRRPYLAVGWFWYVVTLAPVIGLIQTGSQSRADRYTYIPTIGLSLALVWEIAERLQPWPRFRVALAAAVTAACLTLTWLQVQYWRDDISLYQHAVAVVPDNYLAYFNLASALDAQGKTDEAIAQLREAVRVRPYYVPARAELGQLLARQGHPDEALSELQTAVRLRPDDSVAHFRLGSVLGTLGRPGDAAAEFSQAVRLQPENADAHYNLGIALAQEDRVQEAAREFGATVRLRPDDVNARFNLGIALARLGKLEDAIVQFSEAVRLKPDFADAHRALEQAISLRESPAKQ